MAEVPDEITDLMLLRKLPGYTRRLLDAEPAETVVRWLIMLEEENAEQERQSRK